MLKSIDIRKFNTLIEINTLINSNYSDIHPLLTRIIESACRLCEGEAASLLLVNPEEGKLYFEVALGAKGAEVKKYTVRIGEGIAGWVAQHNTSLVVNDAENDDRHLHSISKNIHFPANNILAVPMRSKDRCVGVIEILNKKKKKDFSQEDLEWLEIFANQAALAIQNARSFEKAQDQIEELRDQLSPEVRRTLIAKSPVIQEMLIMIERIAKTDSSVLILGESGVGKELFAEQIHFRSKRAKAPFIRVNCAAIPEGLLESELFGHVKGAFTNAIKTRQGRFEMADGGTIFLDEIGDLPLPLQAKLLRVIQQKTFEKVGSDISITVDVRILAATNRDIESLAAQGKFRRDLYYRLNVLPLTIPPLRARPEDILELADFFLARFARKNQKEMNGFSGEAMEALLAYDWPGNVRELENCIERACVIGNGRQIQLEDLLLKSGTDLPGVEEGSGHDLKTTINAFKTRFIRKVLEECNWNQTEAAKVLDIQRTYLSRLIKELKIVNHKEIIHDKG
ncbi:MAG: sigma 54-interacting transcriptional regulator [Treponema sp.]|jgi:Nif-specific regulatory protein|nr:sigma 54-interacting transcriptional regulator [Treponema sp.]